MRTGYQEYAPDATLAPFAECLWSVTTLMTVPAYLVLPDGCVDIVFLDGEGLRAVGTMTTRLEVTLGPRERAVGIRFRPGAAAAFLGCLPRELTDRSVPLDEIWRLLRLRVRPGGAHLAAECGCSDQAHFIHEFHTFSGYTPAEYARAHVRFQQYARGLSA